jgi:AcrR family transcriptional regulator
LTTCSISIMLIPWERADMSQTGGRNYDAVVATSPRGADGAVAGTRARILASAEQMFADHGLDGVSVRQISQHAGVPTGLISYHFGGKDGLYRACFEARRDLIVDQRMVGLALAETEADADRRLELLVKALIVPMIRLRNSGDSSYIRLLSREVFDPRSNERGIIRELYDPVAERMIAAIVATLPGATLQEVHWGYHIMLGTMTFVVGDGGRIARLSEGRCDPDDSEGTIAHLVTLLVAALKHGRLSTKGRAEKEGTK